MSFKIGQYRKKKSVNYIKLLSYFTKTVNNNKILFTTDSTNLLNIEKYYFKIKIARKTTKQTIKLILQNQDSTDIQKVATYIVPPATDLINEDVYETILVPLTSNYSTVVFEASGQTLLTDDIDLKIYKIENILDLISIESLVRIGVQAAPGQLFCVNGEGLRVGPSGLYELNHSDIVVDFVGFIPTENEDNFILDYQY
jgi:hypothetical protein